MAERWVVRIIKWDGLKINKLHHGLSVVWGAIDSRKWRKMLDEGVHGENFKHAIQYWILACIWKMPICYVYNFGLNLKARAVYELGEVSRVSCVYISFTTYCVQDNYPYTKCMDTVDNRKKSLLPKQCNLQGLSSIFNTIQKAKLIVVSGRLELKWTNQKKYLFLKSLASTTCSTKTNIYLRWIGHDSRKREKNFK